jgi:hypothetical protein
MTDTREIPVFDTGQRAIRHVLMHKRIAAILSNAYDVSPAIVDRQVAEKIMDAIYAEEWGPLA